ncbi:unnamed protein product, partial [Linum tenue]
ISAAEPQPSTICSNSAQNPPTMARSFSDHPGDLLIEIMGKLEVDADHVRASSVCLSWLTAVETLCVSRALKGNQPLKTSLFHKPSQALGGALQQYSTSALRVHELLARRELYTFPTVHNQAQLGVQNFQLVGSSLGLLCVISGLRIYLYNPYFRWFRQVNNLQLRSRTQLLNLRNAGLGLLWEPDISVSVRASGFGFDLNSHQFKFMRVLEYLNSNYQVVEVYSIASGVVQSAPWSLFDPLLCMDLTLLSACEESPLLLSESVHFGSDILATAGEIDLHNVLTKRIFLSALHFRINTRYKASAASAFIVRICRLLQSNWITVIMEGKVILLQLQEALAEAVLLADLEQDTVGMATNIPPHNLGELVNVLCTLIHNPEATLQELLEYMPGPDFPTGGLIMGNLGEIPLEFLTISIDGVTDIRDESDRTGMRIVIELKRGAEPALVLNKLYRLTQLQSSFTRNMVGILDGQPKLMGLKELLQTFLDVRCSVVERRARFKLSQAQEKRHIVEGIVVGLDNLDHILQIIKEASSNAAASTSLMNEFNISSKQAEAILDISLRRLIHMERSKYVDEKKSLTEQISKLEELLASKGKMLQLIEQEAVELKHKFSNPRRSMLEYSDDGQLEDINAIPNEEILLAISEKGYVNRMKPNTFNLQKRGTIGKSVGKLRVNNAMSDFMVCRSHDHILYLRYSHHAFSKSQVVVMFSEEEWHLAAVFVVGFSLTEDFESDEQVVLVSQSGTVNRIKVRDISIQPRYARGVILMRLEYAGKIQLASLRSRR